MQQTMSLDEKLTISNKALDLLDSGDEEGFSRLIRTAPMPPYLAKFLKDKVGVDLLKKSGFNLTEAEAEFGPNWLNT